MNFLSALLNHIVHGPSSAMASPPCPHFSTDVRYLRRHGAKSEDHFRLAFRLHGGGASKVLLLGSLHSTSASWRYSIEMWLGAEGSDLQFLTIDNRGMGDSDMPQNSVRFTTTEMARDVLEVLRELGWTSLHIVGPSMGGMVRACLAFVSYLLLNSCFFFPLRLLQSSCFCSNQARSS